MDMKLLFARKPFSLHVSKGFPQEEGFTFFDYSQGLFLSTDKVDKQFTEAETRSTLSLGEHFAITWDYTYDNGKHIPFELRCDLGNVTFTDINSDGQFDIRVVEDGATTNRKMSLWYRGQWQETGEGAQEKYVKPLASGEVLHFDRVKGVWHVNDE